jgi:uncharacterized protein (DUF433 family)
MSTLLEEAENLLCRMLPSEKAVVLKWVVADLGDAFPGIESNSDVCGGEPCIVRTRIPVWVLAQAWRSGLKDAEILRCYPTLNAEDLSEARGFFRSHRQEIEQQMADNENA